MEISEKNIIDLLQKADQQAIRLIYDKWGHTLYGVSLQIVKDQHLSENVIQDSLISIWKNASKYDPGKAKLFTWIYQIVRNKSIDCYRKQQKNRTENIQNAGNNVSYYHAEDWLKSVELRKNISDLDPKYQEVIDFLYLQGFSQREMAKETGIPLGTIKTRFKKALELLRKVYTGLSVLLLVTILLYG